MASHSGQDSDKRKVMANSEARIYSLNNTYLTQQQKAEVESVYQFPIGIFAYPFVISALVFDQSFLSAFLIASLFSAAAWLAARFFSGRIFFYIGLICGGWIATVLQLGLAGWAATETRYGVAVFTALHAFGITSLLTIGMWLWTFSSRRIHPKYGIAKRLFGVTFPFEGDLQP